MNAPDRLAVGDAFRVVCRDKAHEEGILVAAFDLAAGDQLVTLDEVHGDPATARGRRSTSRVLDAADQVVEHPPTTIEEVEAVTRIRHRFACPACGLTVEAREEILAPIVWTLLGRGVEEVTLVLLGVLVTDAAARGRRSAPH